MYKREIPHSIFTHLKKFDQSWLTACITQAKPMVSSNCICCFGINLASFLIAIFHIDGSDVHTRPPYYKKRLSLFFFKYYQLLAAVHSHRQRVWAHPGTAARTLTIRPGVCECVSVINVDAGQWWERGWMTAWSTDVCGHVWGEKWNQHPPRTTHCIQYGSKWIGEHVDFRCLRVGPRRTA